MVRKTHPTCTSSWSNKHKQSAPEHVQITSGFREKQTKGNQLVNTNCVLWYKKQHQTSKLQSTGEKTFQVTGQQQLERLSQWTSELRMRVQVACARIAQCISSKGDNSAVSS